MSRLVKAIPAGSNRKGLVAQMASARGSTPAKEYWERVAKYIPSEIIAAFIAINCSLANSEPNLKYWLSLANLIMCAIFTPIYLGLAANKNEPKKTQQIVSFFAFLIFCSGANVRIFVFFVDIDSPMEIVGFPLFRQSQSRVTTKVTATTMVLPRRLFTRARVET